MNKEMNKEEMIDEIIEVIQTNDDFLFNEMHGMDVMIDAFISMFRKMKKEELEIIRQKAIKAKREK